MNDKKKRILILGASGMLGSTLFRYFSTNSDMITFGTIRQDNLRNLFPQKWQHNLISKVDVKSDDDLIRLFAYTKPDIVINCVGLIKQKHAASANLETIALNAMLPHRLYSYCQITNARLIHFSTDCVFSGAKGQYREGDIEDATDLYGRSKALGEISYTNSITLRTSIIGHELNSNLSLIDWFLKQENSIDGFTKAVFSGLPTIEIAHIIEDKIIPNPTLSGLYHLSSEPINKFDLLALVADTYGKQITVHPNDAIKIDRSLNSDRFREATSFEPKPWLDLINIMHADYEDYHHINRTSAYIHK